MPLEHFFYRPQLVLQTMAPAQPRLEDKLGGLPWGLPRKRWPLCKGCGKPQSLLAQWVHDAHRLDLKAKGRSLLTFQCAHDPGNCRVWDSEQGANAVVLLDPAEMTDSLTPPPTPDTRVQVEARVKKWTRRAEPPEPVSDTKLGGRAFWIQQPEYGLLTRGWSYVGQLDNCYHFDGPTPSPDAVGCKVGRKVKNAYVYEKPRKVKPDAPPWIFVDEKKQDGSFYCMGPNFGDAGIGYVFLRFLRGKPEGRFTWQCG